MWGGVDRVVSIGCERIERWAREGTSEKEQRLGEGADNDSIAQGRA